MQTTDILVVGAGPVGLALAGDLGWRGRQVIVVEMTNGSIQQPKMDMVGIRTMEFCRRWGIASAVEQSPYVRSYPQDNVYLTSLAGYELGRQVMPSMADDRPPPGSPQKRERCPQNMFDPILRDFATSFPSVTLHYRHKLESFEEDGDGVTSVVLDLENGNAVTIRSKFIVGADGAHSIVRDQLGIQMRGRGILTYTTNAIFRCSDFNERHNKRPGYRYMFVGPDGVWATIVAINGCDLWRMSIIGGLEKKTLIESELIQLAHRAMGHEFPLEMLSILPWARAELVADSYGTSRALICGDACHRTSPTGGLGMNTGIGDAVDLSWKLDALLSGWGGPALIESYTKERKPVAHRITEFSTGNLEIMKGARSSAKIYEDNESGRQARTQVGEALHQGLQREWLSMNMHLGNRYLESPIIVYESESIESAKAELEDAVNYLPTSRPGVRAPHAWMKDGRSTLDLFGRGYVLLKFTAAQDTAALEKQALETGMPLSVISIDDSAIASLYKFDLVLVRPDGHVAWRSNAQPASPQALLAWVTGHKHLEEHTMCPDTPDFATASSLPDLYEMLDRVKMKNGWNKPNPSLYPEPKQIFIPALWRFTDARAALHRAGGLVDPKWAERRNLIMANPIPGNDYPTVTTLVGAYQMVKPGETARSHRHSPNAMRFVVEADPCTYTIVDGTKVPMEPGDVLLTPMGCWHGHSNESEKEAYWIDFLDAPLVQLLGPMFFEHLEGLEQAEQVDATSPMRFAFTDYMPRLLAASEMSPGVRALKLGPETLRTFDRTVISVTRGAEFKWPKTTVSRIYTVVKGRGCSIFEASEFEWAVGDMIAVPNWQRHMLRAEDDAVLLQVSDEPTLQMLGWVREERAQDTR